jgi:hypothetical protein
VHKVQEVKSYLYEWSNIMNIIDSMIF